MGWPWRIVVTLPAACGFIWNVWRILAVEQAAQYCNALYHGDFELLLSRLGCQRKKMWEIPATATVSKETILWIHFYLS